MYSRERERERERDTEIDRDLGLKNMLWINPEIKQIKNQGSGERQTGRERERERERGRERERERERVCFFMKYRCVIILNFCHSSIGDRWLKITDTPKGRKGIVKTLSSSYVIGDTFRTENKRQEKKREREK